ncbi:unnamed protein product [Rotaria sp. Silwood2]|nr:unnamed protein product [Rotaria sp. Silwood2]
MEEILKLCQEQISQCSICCNNIENRTDIFQIELCHCQFCIQCVRQYCVSQVNTALVLIGCPNIKCDSLLTLNEIRPLLTDSQFHLYTKRLFDHEVTNDPQRIFCPQINCGRVLTLSNEQKIEEKQSITCTKCQSTFCLKCRCQWHPHQRCSDLLTPNEMETESNIKRCPQCRFPLEWTDGCAQIMCINCKHMFCWYCLKSLDNDFFLLHYERGPCRNRLGHSRASLFLHRLIIIGLFIAFIILFIIATPLLILIAPCLISYRYKQIKNYFNNLTKWRQNSQQPNTSTIHRSLINVEQQSITPLLSSLNIDECNESYPIYDSLSV